MNKELEKKSKEELIEIIGVQHNLLKNILHTAKQVHNDKGGFRIISFSISDENYPEIAKLLGLKDERNH